jgi:hypothetical protein
MRRKSLDVILAVALLFVVVSGFAHTWQQTANPSRAGATAMSAGGRIICVIPSTTHPSISTDAGKTWTVATNSPPWGSLYSVGLAINADGSKIFAVLSTNAPDFKTWIFESTDQGTNWTKTAFPSTTTSTNYSVACSADGTKVIASLGNGPIFYSTNGGINCYTSSVPNAAWSWLASSADGSRMLAAVNIGGVYFSSDFGATWTTANPQLPGCNSVCTSSDGKWVGAVGNAIYISSNGGVTWRTNNIGGQTIACSANGTNWIVAGDHIYTSVDAGVTWTTNFSTAQWVGGVVSADGCEMAAVGSGQGTWIGRVTPSPQLNIQPQNFAFTISWLLASTNFVLQQSADLSSSTWTSVSPNPTLNFSNLNQQVSVSVTGSNAFFRLIAQ